MIILCPVLLTSFSPHDIQYACRHYQLPGRLRSECLACYARAESDSGLRHADQCHREGSAAQCAWSRAWRRYRVADQCAGTRQLGHGRLCITRRGPECRAGNDAQDCRHCLCRVQLRRHGRQWRMRTHHDRRCDAGRLRYSCATRIHSSSIGDRRDDSRWCRENRR